MISLQGIKTDRLPMNKIVKNLLLAFFLASFALTACDGKLSCSLQAVAGGSQYCQEKGDQ